MTKRYCTSRGCILLKRVIYPYIYIETDRERQTYTGRRRQRGPAAASDSVTASLSRTAIAVTRYPSSLWQLPFLKASTRSTRDTGSTSSVTTIRHCTRIRWLRRNADHSVCSQF